MSTFCALCGESATGLATIWTARDGDRRYCHDDDKTPTCYERAQWGASSDDPHTTLAAGPQLLKGFDA